MLCCAVCRYDDDSAYASKPKKGEKDSSYNKQAEDEGEYVSSKPKKDAYKKAPSGEEVADDYTSKSYKKAAEHKKKDNTYKEQEQYEYK